MMTPQQSARAAAASPHPKCGEGRSRSGQSRVGASATNRCPQQRFACTDGLNPVVFHIERIEEAS